VHRAFNARWQAAALACRVGKALRPLNFNSLLAVSLRAGYDIARRCVVLFTDYTLSMSYEYKLMFPIVFSASTEYDLKRVFRRATAQ
jgi:hypothetical protein